MNHLNCQLGLPRRGELLRQAADSRRAKQRAARPGARSGASAQCALRQRPLGLARLLRQSYGAGIGARGIELAGRRSKPIDVFDGQRFNHAVSLCDCVRGVCPDSPRGMPGGVSRTDVTQPARDVGIDWP